jgi:biopolymer transport protein ExbD
MNLSSKNKVHVETGMSALSDIIFMLLIFFIIASTMAVNGEQVDLPKTDGKPTQASTTVTITKDLRFLVDNVEMPKESIEARLQEIYATSSDKKIVLNVDGDVPTRETVELLAMLKHNNWQPFIATKPKDEKP